MENASRFIGWLQRLGGLNKSHLLGRVIVRFRMFYLIMEWRRWRRLLGKSELLEKPSSEFVFISRPPMDNKSSINKYGGFCTFFILI